MAGMCFKSTRRGTWWVHCNNTTMKRDTHLFLKHMFKQQLLKRRILLSSSDFFKVISCRDFLFAFFVYLRRRHTSLTLCRGWLAAFVCRKWAEIKGRKWCLIATSQPHKQSNCLSLLWNFHQGCNWIPNWSSLILFQLLLYMPRHIYHHNLPAKL